MWEAGTLIVALTRDKKIVDELMKAFVEFTRSMECKV
jgi:hypothetical protein